MVRPLSKTYDPANPFVSERYDQEDGSIVYEVWDHRPDSCRRVCVCAEDYVDEELEMDELSDDRGQTKKDADMIVTALNMIYGQRQFKSAVLRSVQSVAPTVK